MTPAKEAKRLGAKSLSCVSEETKQSLQTLRNWFYDKPDLFRIVVKGVVCESKEKKQCTCPNCEHDFEALPVPDGEFITCPLCKSKLTPNGQGDL